MAKQKSNWFQPSNLIATIAVLVSVVAVSLETSGPNLRIESGHLSLGVPNENTVWEISPDKLEELAQRYTDDIILRYGPDNGRLMYNDFKNTKGRIFRVTFPNGPFEEVPSVEVVFNHIDANTGLADPEWIGQPLELVEHERAELENIPAATRTLRVGLYVLHVDKEGFLGMTYTWGGDAHRAQLHAADVTWFAHGVD